jgi:hypothetical protein
MDKQQAIQWVKRIQGGQFDRNEIKDRIPKGKLAENLWNDGTFSYGMEYGAIMAVMKIFDLEEIE